MGTGDDAKVRGVGNTDKGHEVFQVNLVGSTGSGIVDIGKPLQFRRDAHQLR